MKLRFLILATGTALGLFASNSALAEGVACQKLFLSEAAPVAAKPVELAESVGISVLKSTSPDARKMQMLGDLLEGANSLSESFLLQFLSFVPHTSNVRKPWTPLQQAITNYSGRSYEGLTNASAPVELLMLQTALLKTKIEPNRENRQRLLNHTSNQVGELIALSLKQVNLSETPNADIFKADIQAYFQNLVTDTIYPEMKTGSPSHQLN